MSSFRTTSNTLHTTQSFINLSHLSFKLLVIGDASVGKSSIIRRYQTNQFDDKYTLTIGVDFVSKKVLIDDEAEVQLQIWDTAGQEYFKSVIRSFYKDATAVFLVYNVGNEESFLNLDSWMNDIIDNTDEQCIKILVANQNDRSEEDRVITKQMGVDYMNRNEMHFFFETSALTGENVEMAFTETAKLIFLNYIRKSLESSTSVCQQIQRNPSIQLNNNHIKTQNATKKSKCC